MQVSQVQVRKALLQLENLGLVRRVLDTGTTVTKLTRAEMVELVEVRAHLEDLAFRLPAKRMTPELVHLLRKAAKEISRRASTDDYYVAARADWSLIGSCGRPVETPRWREPSRSYVRRFTPSSVSSDKRAYRKHCRCIVGDTDISDREETTDPGGLEPINRLLGGLHPLRTFHQNRRTVSCSAKRALA
jgi:DNA-binding GntR family transcriptional regulator